MTYVVGVNEQGILQSLYWGPKLSDRGLLPVAKSLPERASQYAPAATTPQEYPAFGAGIFLETALKVNSPNGDRTLILKYEPPKITSPHLKTPPTITTTLLSINPNYK